MSALKLSNCENVPEYASKIQGYVNDFNLCADSSTGTMPKTEHSYSLMQGIPKNDDWRFLTQLMYDKRDTLADKPDKIVTKMKARHARYQPEVDFERIELLALPKTQRHSKKRKAKQTWKSCKSHDSGSECDGSSWDIEIHANCGTKWRDTQ
jgi:hypothetical protein